MMRYGQFCPIAKAAEIVAERWTPLVVHELLAGSTRFNDIRRGVPLMSPSLLSTRLKELERVGIVERRGHTNGAREYHLTEAGLALAPIIHQLGECRTLSRVEQIERAPDADIFFRNVQCAASQGWR